MLLKLAFRNIFRHFTRTFLTFLAIARALVKKPDHVLADEPNLFFSPTTRKCWSMPGSGS